MRIGLVLPIVLVLVAGCATQGTQNAQKEPGTDRLMQSCLSSLMEKADWKAKDAAETAQELRDAYMELLHQLCRGQVLVHLDRGGALVTTDEYIRLCRLYVTTYWRAAERVGTDDLADTLRSLSDEGKEKVAREHCTKKADEYMDTMIPILKALAEAKGEELKARERAWRAYPPRWRIRCTSIQSGWLGLINCD